MTQTTKKRPKTGDPHPGGGVYLCRPTLKEARKAIKKLLNPGVKLLMVRRYGTFYEAYVRQPKTHSSGLLVFERMCWRITYSPCFSKVDSPEDYAARKRQETNPPAEQHPKTKACQRMPRGTRFSGTIVDRKIPTLAVMFWRVQVQSQEDSSLIVWCEWGRQGVRPEVGMAVQASNENGFWTAQ